MPNKKCDENVVLKRLQCGDIYPNFSATVLITVRQQSCGKAIFSVVCVCQSVCPQGSHVTITHDALDLTVQAPMGPHVQGPPASDIWWPRLETCPKLFT